MVKEFMFLMNLETPEVLKDEYPDVMPRLAWGFRVGKLRAKVIVRLYLEHVAGEPCHVVEIIDDSSYQVRPREYKTVFWLAQDKGMCVMKSQRLLNGKVEREIVIERIARVALDSGNLWYPQKGYRTLHSDRFGTKKRELTVTEFVPNVNVDESTFRINYESGTRVLAGPSMNVFTWRDGMKFVADELANDIRYVPQDWSIMVGIGRPLPTFESIELGAAAGQIKDRAALLCFLDMEQWPSRNCLQQLWAKRRELAEKGVLAVMSDAAEPAEIEPYDWAKKHGIAFPPARVKADIDKTRFTWGVRSLPWLILSDERHVVTAEGFSTSELDEKLRGDAVP